MPGFPERVESSLRSILPVGTIFQVKRAKDPLTDAWHGAAMVARNAAFKKYAISRREYEEYGGEYIKEHGLGNVFRR